MKIGNLLKRLREQCGYTQKNLAEFLGISENELFEIENGNGVITANTLYRLSSLYGVPENILASGADDISPMIPSCDTTVLQADDLKAMSAVNRIALNQNFMTGLLGEIHNNTTLSPTETNLISTLIDKAWTELERDSETSVLCPKCNTHPKLIVNGNRSKIKCECGYIYDAETYL